MTEMEASVLPLINISSTYKKMIRKYHHTALDKHSYHIYTFESFAKEGRHPSWNTMILGPVLAHISSG